MIKQAQEILQQIHLYDDSEELAQALEAIADNDVVSGNHGRVYHLKESAQHIRSMHALIHELARRLAAEIKTR